MSAESNSHPHTSSAKWTKQKGQQWPVGHTTRCYSITLHSVSAQSFDNTVIQEHCHSVLYITIAGPAQL